MDGSTPETCGQCQHSVRAHTSGGCRNPMPEGAPWATCLCARDYGFRESSEYLADQAALAASAQRMTNLAAHIAGVE